jgi:apolipoprotein N-acyltransferase
MTIVKNKNLLSAFGLLILSAGLLTVIQPPFGLSGLAFVALVPFILACISAEKLKPILFASYIISFLYWLFNLYWLIPVTAAGWFVGCLYMAILWPVLAVALRFCTAKKIPLLISVPILFVGAERLQGFFLGGFFWRFLAHSQYENLYLIQISDIFGAAGVSFLIAMVNALIAEIIYVNFKFQISNFKSQISNFKFLLKVSIVSGLIFATILYGRWRITQTDKLIEQGPLVGAVQSCIPQSVKESAFDSNEVAQDTFNKLAADSNSVIAAGASLCVWPETMIPAYLDDRLLDLSNNQIIRQDFRYFNARLSSLALGRAYILVGAGGLKPQYNKDYSIESVGRCNSAFLYTPDGRQAIDHYNKIHIVPFGEYVPFRRSIPFIHKLLMKFTPYDYDYSLDAGDEFTIFQIYPQSLQRTDIADNIPQKNYKFAVMICYEDTTPQIARKFILDSKGQKQVDWLLNISNDGWFVKFTPLEKATDFNRDSLTGFINGRAVPSTELAQHTAICVFRAVENRTPVVRSVNTGISCLIDSTGKIRDGFLAGNLPQRAFERKGMAGWFVDKLPIDKRITLFSRFGQWLDNSCAICLAAAVVAGLATMFFTMKRS